MSHNHSYLRKVLSNLWHRMIEARQKQADYQVARFLQREYPNESYDYLLKVVQNGNIEELRK